MACIKDAAYTFDLCRWPDAQAKGSARLERQKHSSLLLAVIVVALAVASVMFWRTEVATDRATAMSVWLNGDLFHQYYPMKELIFSRLRAGQIPLWNPYVACGFPLLATLQSGTFYPLNFPHLFMDADDALSCVAVIHLFLCGLLMMVYCRSRGNSIAAAAVGALTYMFCGMTLGSLFVPQRLFAGALFPAVFLCAEKMADTRKARWAALLGLVLAAQVLAGSARMMVVAAQMAGLLLSVEVVSSWRRARRLAERVQPLYLFALALVLMAAISAIQVLPTNELRTLGWRAHLSFGEASLGTTIKVGTLLRDIVAVPQSGYPPVRTRVFFGMLAPLLIPFAFYARKGRRRIWLYTLLGLLGLVLTSGNATPLYKVYYHLVPFGKLFRQPGRFLQMTGFAISALSAAGFDSFASMRLSGSRTSRHQIALRLVPFLAMIAVVLHTNADGRRFLFGILVALALIRAARSAPVRNIMNRRGTSINRPLLNAAIPAGRLLLEASILVLGGWSLWAGYTNYFNLNSMEPEGSSVPRKYVEFIQEHQGYRRTLLASTNLDRLVLPKMCMRYGIFGIQDHEPMAMERHGQYCLYAKEDRYKERIPYFHGFSEFGPEIRCPRLMRQLATKYYVVAEEEDTFGEVRDLPVFEDLVVAFKGEGMVVYEDQKSVPRASFIQFAEICASPQEVLSKLCDGHCEGDDVVLVEGMASLPVRTSESGSGGTVEIAQYEPEQVRLKVTAPTDGFVLLRDTYCPGWHAYVDGERAPLYRANFLFRCVPVPAGEHDVLFRYRPRSFTIGAVISVSTLAVLAFVGLAVVRKDRQRFLQGRSISGIP